MGRLRLILNRISSRDFRDDPYAMQEHEDSMCEYDESADGREDGNAAKPSPAGVDLAGEAISFGERVHVARCRCCGEWEVRVGNAVLRFEESELRRFHWKLGKDPFESPPHFGSRRITFKPREDARFMLAFTPAEWCELRGLMDEAIEWMDRRTDGVSPLRSWGPTRGRGWT